jgi:hypothetical protein
VALLMKWAVAAVPAVLLLSAVGVLAYLAAVRLLP